jgi:L-aspartate oxidase
MLRALPDQQPTWHLDADVVVIGAGAAGLSAALGAASQKQRVLVVGKGGYGSGSTRWAQGGLAAVLAGDDDAELHAADTQMAGAGLCNPGAVTELTQTAPAEIEKLTRLGARFDRQAGSENLSLGREGGHSRHRVVHAGGDASGAEVSRTLLAAARGAPGIDFLEPAVALDAVIGGDGRVSAVTVGRIAPGTMQLSVGMIHTRVLILATGGAGHVYSHTTNPAGSTGDGIALAVRAGAVVSDMEFVQFHPTVLWTGNPGCAPRPLITEALRGEGAQLLDDRGVRFMAGRHPLAELAPRDVVAAAMQEVMNESGADHLWLDATALGRKVLSEHFPTVLENCRAAGVDPLREPIPVSPAAHYLCGGVVTDLDGRTGVPGLLAVGETACTGLHGANRLASNSLTEALHFGHRAGSEAAQIGNAHFNSSAISTFNHAIGWTAGTATPGSRKAISRAMSSDCGLLRDRSGLKTVLRTLEETPSPRTAGALTLDDVEACSIHTVATLTATAALLREESRGCHRRADFPQTSPQWRTHVALAAEGGAAAGLHRRISA